ncbi:hypothetical protein T01_3248 [Trichinella spiralis]|uniref:Uncharacterized protein n=1 Tax=Trichinella spiralis TaxID=6334 RepID=A0A0V1B8B0_TRISP|nr:hypothetical protein T01_3248 [Trichinella spiralis]
MKIPKWFFSHPNQNCASSFTYPKILKTSEYGKAESTPRRIPPSAIKANETKEARRKQQLDELKLGLIRFQRQLQGQSLVVGVKLGVGLVGIKRAGQDLIEGVLAEYEQHNATVAER